MAELNCEITRSSVNANLKKRRCDACCAAFWIIHAVCIAVLSLFTPQHAESHGGVYLEDELCIIRIAYIKARFKMYLPASRQHEEFCEELPEAGESIFVFEYINQDLGAIPFDFRIIRNVTGRRRFANENDVARIDNLDEITEFYKPVRVEPGVFTAIHQFDKSGAFIGIVTAERTGTGEVYTTVFPFQVGFAGFGYWPLLGVSIVLYFVFLGYSYGWISSWSLSRLLQYFFK